MLESSWRWQLVWEDYRVCVFLADSLDGRGFVGFNVNLIMLGMLLFSIRVLVFCAIVFVGSLSSLVCMQWRLLVQKESLHLFFVVWRVHNYCSVTFVGSTIISVSLFRPWRACRSYLVIFDDGGLALRRITAICIRMLSACSDGSL